LFSDHCCVSEGKSEFKDILASACQIVKLGKRTALGLASTALYRAGRGGAGPVHVFDRQATAHITNYLESTSLDGRWLCEFHR
jgi:hypothetical protein